MKSILILIFPVLFIGCVVKGIRQVHSPNSTDGIGIRGRYHYHSKAKWNSPPDIVRLKASNVDSTFLEIGAHFLEEKDTWAGILFPIIPIPFPRKKDYYENYPNNLFLSFDIYSNKKIDINVDSILLLVNGISYSPKKVSYKGAANRSFFIESHAPRVPIEYRSSLMDNPKVISLQFDPSAKEMDRFEIELAGCFLEKQKINFARIQFTKVEQEVFWFGP